MNLPRKRGRILKYFSSFSSYFLNQYIGALNLVPEDRTIARIPPIVENSMTMTYDSIAHPVSLLIIKHSFIDFLYNI
jgi:hypothetical protein